MTVLATIPAVPRPRPNRCAISSLAADRPVVLEAITDPNVPPLPPHITWEQAKAFASSVWAGDAEALGYITQTVKDAAETYLPHKK